MLDISNNRKAAKYARGELVARAIWSIAAALPFRLSPRVCHRWRAWILRRFGARIGSETHVYGSAMIQMPWQLSVGHQSAIGERAIIYNLGNITIGDRVTISQQAHLCAGSHDFRDPAMPLLKLPVTIEDDAWVCADAFIGPGVTIGKGAVVGARAVVTKDVPPWTVVAGNPAQPIGKRSLRGESSLTDG